MERRVSVNDSREQQPLPRVPELTPDGLYLPGGDEPEHGKRELPATGSGSQGPCLYLGPSGERCDRAALPGGFCARHQPNGGFRLPVRNYTRVLVATIALIVFVWPYISEVIRELLRLLDSR